MTDIQLTVPTVVMAAPALVTVGVIVRRSRRAGWGGRRTALTVLLALYLVAVVAVTLFPFQVVLGTYAPQDAWRAVQPVPVLTIDLRTFVLNVVMFLPLGVLLPLVTRWRTLRQVATAGLCLSLGIELAQYLSHGLLGSDRMGDVNDLIANTAGAALGYAILVGSRTRTGSLDEHDFRAQG